MLRSRRHRILLVAPIVLALALVAPALASADDDAPQPKRVRIKIAKKIEKKGEHAQPNADPMAILHHWFAGHLTKNAQGGEGMEARLKAWFDAGKEAPMAGLRDAFKAHGWDAAQLNQWLSGHAAGAVRGMFGPGVMGAMRVPHSGTARSFTMHGPMARGFGARGMGGQHGMHGRNFAQGGQPHGNACPNCGAGAQRGHGPRTQTWFGQMPNRGGPMMGRFGMRGPMGMGGGRGMGRQGMRRGPFGGNPMGGQGMPGRTHTTSRAYIMWNDGNGWQRREIAPGTGFGTPPSGGMPGIGIGRGPMGPAHPGHGQGHAGHGQAGPRGQAPAPRPGHAPGGMNIEHLEKLLEMLKSMKQGAGKPGAAGQPGQPGSVGGMDAAKLQQILKMLRDMGVPTNGANVQVWPQGGDASSYLELFRRLQPGAKAEPKRVRIKVVEPKKTEEKIEEIEIK